MRRLLLASLLVWVPLHAHATDVGVAAKKLAVVDGGTSGKDKVSFVATGTGVAKGGAADVGGISGGLAISRGAVRGGFSIPAGGLGPGGEGWRQNDASLARYQNPDAGTGVPTGARSVLVRPGKLVKLTAKTIGDEPIDVAALAAESASIRAVTTIVNDGEVYRHCTAFAADDVKVTGPNGAGKVKLVAKSGVPSACPGLVVSPGPDLPPVPDAPHLYFDGSSPASVAEIVARAANPETSGYFASFRSTVDGALATLGTASDDARSKVAKAAGLLQVLGETPPGGSGFASYRDVAVTALLGMVDRTALDSVDEFIDPPPNLLNVLQDSGRLQSMAEAYDFLRGSGVAAADDTAIRALIAAWADAYVDDWNLVGDPFGVFPGHRDNWAIKGGSALVTTALALPGHPSASSWLAAGMTYLNESLHEVVMAPGWYAEGPHYVNYSLNNLASTAWHVRHATGEDWFDDLAPLVDVALALRQPDGESTPFEEGVPNAFPHDVLAAAYPTRAPTMLWAWQNGGQNTSNYDNQQIHSVTRFLVVDVTTVGVAPGEPSTTFLGGDTHAAALRSDWSTDAVQITTMTALDHSADEVFPSRHNTENPLDVTLHGAGAMLLPTASGGPQVTSSANRATYLEPGSKNIPLVDGDAPYLLDPLAVEFGERLDSRDAGGATHRILDVVTTRLPAFAAGVAVERTVGLVADAYGVVVDRFDGGGSGSHLYGATWRGRGDASARSLTAAHLGVDYAWPDATSPAAHLAVDVAGSAGLSGVVDAGLYAPAWGVEETLEPLRVSATATTLHTLTVLRPRADATPATAIEPVGSGSVAAFRVTDGAIEDVIATAPGGSLTADGITSDARLALVRRVAGLTVSLAMVMGTTLDAGPSGGAIEVDDATTVSASVDEGIVVIEVSADADGKRRITLRDLPGVSADATYAATLDGVPLAGGAFSQAGTELRLRVPHGGTVVVWPAP